MSIQSFAQIKFWNKKINNSDFMITAPQCLDNYFCSQTSRNKMIHLPIPINFNNIVNNQSIQCILSKKLRGMKLSINQQNMIKKDILFCDKKTNGPFTIRLEQLFNYYLNYKNFQLNKALIGDKINHTIIKPFLRIFTTVSNKQHLINTSQRNIQKQLNQIFDEVLKQSKLLDQNYTYDCNKIEEYYNESKKRKTSGRIIQQANKILQYLEVNGVNTPQKTIQDKYKIRDLRGTSKNLKTQNENKKNIVNETKINNIQNVQNQTKIKKGTSQKKVRIYTGTGKQNEQKNNPNGQDDSINLCYQLGLLITDTDRILKPIEDDLLLHQMI